MLLLLRPISRLHLVLRLDNLNFSACLGSLMGRDDVSARILNAGVVLFGTTNYFTVNIRHKPKVLVNEFLSL